MNIMPLAFKARLRAALLVVCALLSALPIQEARAQTSEDIPEVVRDLLDRGQRQQAAGRLDQALKAYEEALRLGPDIVETHLGLGAVFVGKGANEKALKAFSFGLEIAPNHRDLLFNAAVIALRLGRHEDALRWASHGIDRHVEDVELYLLQAATLDRLGRNEEALGALQAADRLAPRRAQILFRIGNQLHQLGRDDEAVTHYRQALAEDRSLLRAHYNLGAVLLSLDRFDEALEAYRVALAPFDEIFRRGELPDARHAPAYANLGAIYSQRQEWGEAIGAYEKALRLEPGQADRLYNRGFVYYQSGELEAAVRDYEAALHRRADLPLAYLHLGDMARRQGDCAGSTEHLENGLRYFDTPQRLTALDMMAFCYGELGRPERAEAAYRKVLDASPEDPELLLGLGRLLRLSGRLEQARGILEDAAEARPNHLPTGLELLALAEARGDLESQSQLAEQLLRRHPERAELWRVRWSLALVMLRQGQLAPARQHLEILTDLAPAEEKPRIAALEALCAAALGELGTARQKLEAVARSAPSHGVAAAAAVLAALDGGGEEALLALEMATSKDDIWTSHHTDLGLLYWSLGRPDSARPLLVAAQAAGDQGPALLAALGDLAADLNGSIEYLERARAICDDPPPVRTNADVLRLRLPVQSPGLCDWIADASRRARLEREIGRLPRANIAVAEEVLAAEKARGDEKALAHYLRGMVRVGRGQNAAPDLRRALRSGLPAQLAGPARLYLGVALARRGANSEARRELEATREIGGEIGAAATLNLAILLDDQVADEGETALELYEAYLRTGGPRAAEVEVWAERLRRVYR